MRNKGLIHIYTGEGKGKTTAAIGQAIRALGHNLSVCYVSFHKDFNKWNSGEIKIFNKLGVDIFCFADQHPYLNKRVNVKKLRSSCIKALDFIEHTIFKRHYHILILDEINIALKSGYIKEKELLNIILHKPHMLDIIITGRGVSKKLIEKADLVSEIRKIKHPFDVGIRSRSGIEY